MNRLGPAGRFLPNAATFVYAIDVIIVLAFFLVGIEARLTRPRDMTLAPVILIGVAHLIATLRLGSYLRRRRDEFELAWREIKESPADMLRIHSRYEALPSRIITP